MIDRIVIPINVKPNIWYDKGTIICSVIELVKG